MALELLGISSWKQHVYDADAVEHGMTKLALTSAPYTRSLGYYRTTNSAPNRSYRSTGFLYLNLDLFLSLKHSSNRGRIRT